MLYEPDSSFEFDSVTLGSPNGLQGGSYFTKLLVKKQPLYLQIPKCKTKQGLVVTEKKKYCDLMFTRDDTNVIEWFETIEQKAQNLMFEKKNIWFHDDLELSDIENAFTSPIRSYRSGNYYLVRCMFPKVISSETISCFNENEEPVSIDVLNEDNIEVIPLVEVQGIKFSSKNFQIEIGMRQIMVIKKKEIFKNCMIKVPKGCSDKTLGGKKTATSPEQILKNEVVALAESTDNKDETLKNEDVALAESAGNKDEALKSEDVALAESAGNKDEALKNEDVALAESAGNKDEALKSEDVALAESAGNKDEALKNEDVALAESAGNKDEALKSEDVALKNKDVGLKNEVEDSLEVKLEEVDLTPDDNNVSMVLKDPSEVYYNMWREARQKAKDAKKEAVAAYLEAKKIKENFMLDAIDSDSDEDSEYQQLNLA